MRTKMRSAEGSANMCSRVVSSRSVLAGVCPNRRTVRKLPTEQMDRSVFHSGHLGHRLGPVAEMAEQERQWGFIAYLESVKARDPAARSRWEVLLYPGVIALGLHRFAHWLWEGQLYFPGRLVNHIARFLSAIDIHP